MNKQQIIEALYRFINQRSGIDYANYGERESFMGDYRPILKRGKQARLLLQAVALRDSISAEDVMKATRAFSGRLQIVERDGRVAVDYCAGQYFPTEYRSAACAVLAQCLWDYFSANAPDPTLHHNTETGEIVKRYRGDRMGDYIRKHAARELGRGIAKDWFN